MHCYVLSNVLLHVMLCNHTECADIRARRVAGNVLLGPLNRTNPHVDDRTGGCSPTVEIRSTPPQRPRITASQAARRRIWPNATDVRTIRRHIESGDIPGCVYRPEHAKQDTWYVYTDVPPFTPNPAPEPAATAQIDATTLTAALQIISDMQARQARRDAERDAQILQALSAIRSREAEIEQLIADVRAENAALRADQLDYESRITLLLAAQAEKDKGAAEILSGAQRFQRALELTQQVITDMHLPSFGPTDT